jgi:hypothetical protein
VEVTQHEEDFDLKSHNSDSCRTCLAIRCRPPCPDNPTFPRHQADLASARML